MTSVRKQAARIQAREEALSITEANSAKADDIVRLCNAWILDPQAFFVPWSVDDSSSDNAPRTHETQELLVSTEATRTLAEQELVKQDLWWKLEQLRKVSAPRFEDRVRQIMYKIFFRDLVVSQSVHRKCRKGGQDGLPRRGLPRCVSEAWQKLTGEKLSEQTRKELSGYVKDGQRYLALGDKVGQCVWLLLPEQVSDSR